MKWQHALVLIVLCFISFTAMCKNPVLKNTKWTAIQEMFVADAGTNYVPSGYVSTADGDWFTVSEE